ncbi:MAG: DUF523 domain-containing protein [Deltaproteobacteria bacterium]|nr:DUF523 domain-containing protein [Deltaproteobacteria bacterium]
MVNQSRKNEKAILSGRPALYLVSACLLGLRTRYDGKLKPCEECCAFLAGALWIPVCPEQLGGLPTPRPAADIVGGDGFDVLAGRARVVTRLGDDITAQFLLGARQALTIAGKQQISGVILKSKSPSCGMTPGFGVTAALLEQNGFQLIEY